MPGARTHDILTVATGAAAAGAYWSLTPHPDWTHAAIFTGTYLFAGFACAGDLDLCSAQYRRWGPLRFLWWPYQKIVPHRSWISHGLLLGGLIRVAYLLGMLTLVAAAGFWLFGRWHGVEDAHSLALRQWASLGSFVQAHPVHSGLALAGFVLAGTVHTLTDVVFSFFKRVF